ncbi:hypothetical protein N7491_001335 [Penicillium cf. griseofulvum]|uniref:Endo-beta-1,2-glucanase SGL domain-containing protein n=1 Tax=Penicillium cf. griseofulvum TaxID=2972120 RepID=A0A9W9JDH5_9EURO|nr:hypothetical protein N7472_006467 [Penicillium cf. griseofulvum]KAJ5445253.1 hypothetical protein N7491_001335 [Penicillium cf. griseofulvum]KAJ5446974.1 hypothetical protein N7445_001795 [Penicillium cf. griseofulvum]
MRFHEKLGHVLIWTTLVNALPSVSGHTNKSSCRFAYHYSQKQVLQDPTVFINDMLYWEDKFHQNNISYNSNNGISYDGTNIDWVTGEATVEHTFSPASKEFNEKDNTYGSTESTRVDGTGVSALPTWDSNVTTVDAILGEVTDFVRQKMKAHNLYDEFVDLVEVVLPALKDDVEKGIVNYF